MADMKTECCGRCNFYQEHEQTAGLCRRNPPQIIVIPQKTFEGPRLVPMPMQPRVGNADWCAEFRENPDLDEESSGVAKTN